LPKLILSEIDNSNGAILKILGKLNFGAQNLHAHKNSFDNFLSVQLQPKT